MNLRDHPDLLDQLAASHALGTLRGGARRRFETLARENPGVRARALLWQECFASLTELQPADLPSPNVWKRIENDLAALQVRRVPAAPTASDALLQRLRRALGLWRGAALAGALATVAAVAVGVRLDHQLDQSGVQLAQLQSVSQVEYVAVLQDDKASASVLVTFDPAKRSLTLKRVGSYQEASDRSLQLWALPVSGGPKSLGVIGEGPLVRLTAAEGEVAPVPTLAISLEPKGGVPPGSGPTGPILFKGPLLKTTL
ncbi:anti-sigma factor [Xylophilus sp. GW821-FHT01B05]